MKTKILKHSPSISILCNKWSSTNRVLKDTLNSSAFLLCASAPAFQNYFIARLNFQVREKKRKEKKNLVIKKCKYLCPSQKKGPFLAGLSKSN